MIIGIDFDGTIADTNSQKSTWIQQELGMQVPRYLCDRTSCVPIIGEFEYKRMCAQVYSRDTTLRLPAVPGALEAILELQKNNQLIVVTARIKDMLDSAKSWLSGYPETASLEIIGVSVNIDTKTEVCHKRGVHVLVDDDERHLRDALAVGISAILFKQSGSKHSRSDGIHVCQSWNEIVSCLQRLRQARPNRKSN